MSERDVLNKTLLPYKVNMNTVTPLIDKVVADEGSGGSDVLTVHVIGGEEYTADAPVSTVWARINAGELVVVEFKETVSSSVSHKYYPVMLDPGSEGEGYEKCVYFIYPAEEEYMICGIVTNPQPAHDVWGDAD